MKLGIGLYGVIFLWVAAVLLGVLWFSRRRAGAYDIAADTTPGWRLSERILAAGIGLTSLLGIVLSVISAT